MGGAGTPGHAIPFGVENGPSAWSEPDRTRAALLSQESRYSARDPLDPLRIGTVLSHRGPYPKECCLARLPGESADINAEGIR
jgi:hypothetical protein